MEDRATMLATTAHRERLFGVAEREALAAAVVAPIDVGAVGWISHWVVRRCHGQFLCIGRERPGGTKIGPRKTSIQRKIAVRSAIGH
jgi:hypothetical protein